MFLLWYWNEKRNAVIRLYAHIEYKERPKIGTTYQQENA
jgi:hypothetical protein